MILITVIVRGNTAEIMTTHLHDTTEEDKAHAQELIDAMTGERRITDSGERKTDGAQTVKRY